MVEYFSDLSVELRGGLFQIDPKQDVRLTWTVFAHVLGLLVKAGIYCVILVPGDKAARSAILSIVQPIPKAWCVVVGDLTRPCVREPSSSGIHFEDILNKLSGN